MASIQMANGKAFEYACLAALYEKFHILTDVSLQDSPQLQTARQLFLDMPSLKRDNLMLAANAATRALVQLEPQLQYHDNSSPLYLSLQTDAQGIAGDVRDVLCMRRQNQWQIGLSCKHNHHAVKHSRLSETIDFGQAWFGVPCSDLYFAEVVPLFSELRRIRDDARKKNTTALWADIPDKATRYYIPALQAFLNELGRLAAAHPDIPRELVKYLIGRQDFYKIITDDQHKTTRIEAINLFGTLNRPSDGHRALVEVPCLHLPTRFFHMGLKPGSDNTVEVVCDEGWTISMRVHNASSKVEPSLKFDINLISQPGSVYSQVEPW